MFPGIDFREFYQIKYFVVPEFREFANKSQKFLTLK